MAEPLTRREFAGLVAAGSVLSGATLPAAEPAKSEKKDAGKKALEADAPAATTPIELIIDLVKQQFPHERLDDTALEEVRIDIGQHLNRSKILSSFPLTNAHEPGFVFSAWRADLASK